MKNVINLFHMNYYIQYEISKIRIVRDETFFSLYNKFFSQYVAYLLAEKEK